MWHTSSLVIDKRVCSGSWLAHCDQHGKAIRAAEREGQYPQPSLVLALWYRSIGQAESHHHAVSSDTCFLGFSLKPSELNLCKRKIEE